MERTTASDRLVVEAKRVDSDESNSTTVDLQIPTTELGRRYQIADVVQGLYPEAELRSFAGDVASFLAPKLLIVATYRRSSLKREQAESDAQHRLFDSRETPLY